MVISCTPLWQQLRSTLKWLGLCSICSLLGISTPLIAQGEPTLRALTAERELLSAELDEYNRTIALLQADGIAPEQSANPAVRKLAEEVVGLHQQLVAITQREVTLLQQQIAATREEHTATPGASAMAQEALETKPLRMHLPTDSLAQEAATVQRLHHLLEGYYSELQEAARVLPTETELAQRAVAQRDAQTMERIPFSIDKVRLSGDEGSTALADISERLMDPTIPESRRDIAPICNIRTRLFDTLVASESRSLRPVGKNHYIARVRLQPGDTTLTIRSNHWDLSLPLYAAAGDFLITLYRPPGGTEELHVFAVEELLALQNPHIPAWLPEDLELKLPAG